MRTRLLLFFLIVLGVTYVLFSDLLDPSAAHSETTAVQIVEQGPHIPAAPKVSHPENGLNAPERSAFEPGPQLPPTSSQGGPAQLQILVVSADGETISGVPVSLWTVFEGRPSSLPWKEAMTNVSGLATISLPPASTTYDTTLAVGFPFPCGRSESVTFLRSELPAAPVTLTLAATGAVEVQLLDDEGSPWTHPMSVILANSPGLFKDKRSVLRKEGPGFGIVKTNEQGVVVFPHVALGHALVAGIASVVGNDQWGRWNLEGFAGPRNPGEMVKVQLRLVDPADVIRFRLLDPEGNPVPESDWSALITEYTVVPNKSFATQGRQREQTTDEFGISLCGLPQFKKKIPWTHRSFVLTCALGDGTEKLQATIDLTEDFGPGIHDIGDVQLEPFGPLASGRIASGTRAKLENVSVRVEEEIAAVSDYSGFHRWNPIPRELTLESSGAFALQGSTSAENLRLTFHADGFHEMVKVVEAGSSNLNFAFDASFVVTGRLVLPEGFELSRATIRFIPPGSTATGSGYSGRVSETKIHPDGSFTFSGLEEAVVGEVAVFWGRGETALVRVPGVMPVEAHVLPDTRLNPVQIADIHHYELSFVDEEGEPVRNMRYRIFKELNAMGQDPLVLATSEDLQDGTAFSNHFVLNTQQPQVQVGYWQAGYAYGEQIVHPGETVLTLKQPIMASLKLENHLELPDGLELQAELISDAAGGLAAMRETLPAFIPLNIPLVPLPTPGTYRIQLFLREKGTRKSVSVRWENGSLTKEFVASAETGQVFRVAFPNHNILLAAEQLKGE